MLAFELSPLPLQRAARRDTTPYAGPDGLPRLPYAASK
jgi:hypothetical protein